ncbi:MAG: SRPBCC family protein [Snowella sp.]|nr:SRPBCC family protein [Snowella sp.]
MLHQKIFLYLTRQSKINILTIIAFIFLCFQIPEPCWGKSLPNFSSSLAISPSLISQNNNDITITGNNGNYEIRLLVNSSLEKTWKAITNYTKINNFIPTVISSKVIEAKENQKILDQVYQGDYTLGVKAKVRVQVKESYPKEIKINLVKGDFLNKLQGKFSLQPINSKQLLLIYTVNIDPKIPFSKELFFNMYKDSLIESMGLLKRILESRA